MQRIIVVTVLFSFATGCGAGGKNALFSGNTTRVPPPSTKSYGTADNGYYNGNAPKGLSSNSNPSSLDTAVANNGPGQPGDLNWRAPGTRNNSAVIPASAQLPTVPGNTNRVTPVGYSSPVSQSAPWGRSNENPVRVPDGGTIGSGVAPQVLPASANNAVSAGAPGTYGPSADPNDIANLPKVTNMPRIRLPNTGPPDNLSPPTMYSQPSATTSSPTLNWRTQP